jgi:hypothetical protein
VIDLKRRVHLDYGERAIHFETIQDVEPILDNNARLRGESQKSETFRHIADIPNTVFHQWFNEYNAGQAKPDTRIFGNPEFDKFVQRKLRDSDWSKLLTYDPSTNFMRGWR